MTRFIKTKHVLKNGKEIPALRIEDAYILTKTFRNFTGETNSTGLCHSFNVKIDDERIAQVLTNDGWNIKTTKSVRLDPNGNPYPPTVYLPVKFYYTSKSRVDGKVMTHDIHITEVKSNGDRIDITEGMLPMLDTASLTKVNLLLELGNEWKAMNGSTGRTAYLTSMTYSLFTLGDDSYVDEEEILNPNAELGINTDELPF